MRKLCLALVLCLSLASCIWPGNGEPYPGAPENNIGDGASQIQCSNIDKTIFVFLMKNDEQWSFIFQNNNITQYFAADFEEIETSDHFVYANAKGEISINKTPSEEDLYDALLNLSSDDVEITDLNLSCDRFHLDP